MVHCKYLPVGHLHYDIILLLRPESFKVLLSCANEGFCYSNLTGITKFKYERRNEKDSGRRSKITPSCKWPITCLQILLRGVGNHETVLRPTARAVKKCKGFDRANVIFATCIWYWEVVARMLIFCGLLLFLVGIICPLKQGRSLWPPFEM